MEVLLIQKDQQERERFVFFMESTYGCVLHEATQLDHAHELIQRENPKIDLIIVVGALGNDDEMKKFSMETSSIPSIYILDDALRDRAAGWEGTFLVVDPDQQMEGTVGAIDDWIEQGILEGSKSEQPQVRIRTRLLLSVCPLKGDVFIRLNEGKFVKLFKQGDVFEQSDMEKYTINKGVEYLYIQREQCKEFVAKLGEELKKVLAAGRLTVEGSAKLNESVHEAVHELVANIGFTREVQELVKTQVEVSMRALGKEPSLSDLMKKFLSMEGQYISAHSTLTSYLACGLAVQLQWGSAPTFHKLTLAGFLHDITLNNQELAGIRSLKELEEKKSKFTAEEVKDFREHPIKSAEMTRRMAEVPPDVDTIIRQHHERPDGSGFPGGLEHKYIAPLSSLFIVAHDLADYTLEARDSFNIEVFLQSVSETYKASYFRKILASLETLRKF